MKIFHGANEVRLGGRKTCLAIGFFDGVHLGHQEIIRRTLERARIHTGFSLVLTFDPHPSQVVAPDRAPQLIYPLSHKLRMIEACGPDGLLLIHFDKHFSEQSGAEFVRTLAADLNGLQSASVGANFHFGRERSGNVELLAALGAEMGFAVDAVQVVTAEGANISSTRIREAIRIGDFESASAMLGRTYSLVGSVTRGDRIGRSIGYPTANLQVEGLVLPPRGVYAVKVAIGGQAKPAVLNIGLRPTLQQKEPALRVEVHIPRLNEDLYGRELQIEFTRKLRDEKKFNSLDELRLQISRDVELALRLPTLEP